MDHPPLLISPLSGVSHLRRCNIFSNTNTAFLLLVTFMFWGALYPTYLLFCSTVVPRACYWISWINPHSLNYKLPIFLADLQQSRPCCHLPLLVSLTLFLSLAGDFGSMKSPTESGVPYTSGSSNWADLVSSPNSANQVSYASYASVDISHAVSGTSTFHLDKTTFNHLLFSFWLMCNLTWLVEINSSLS